MSKIIVDVTKIKVIELGKLSIRADKKLEKKYEQYQFIVVEGVESLEEAIAKGRIFWQPSIAITNSIHSTFGFPMIPEEMITPK